MGHRNSNFCYLSRMARPKRRRRSLDSPETLDDVLGRHGENRFSTGAPPIGQRAWISAVGMRIADRAKPISLDRGVLTVRAATAVWASELSLLSEALIARLRAQGFAVTELRFRVGAVEPPARPPERRGSRAVPAPAELPADLEGSIAGIEDDELRQTIRTAAKSNLAWQDNVTAAPQAAPGLRDAETKSARPGQTSSGARGAARYNSEDE